MIKKQDLQQEIDRLIAELANRDRDLVSLRTRLTLDQSGRRAPIVRAEQALSDMPASETFHEALHGLALVPFPDRFVNAGKLPLTLDS